MGKRANTGAPKAKAKAPKVEKTEEEPVEDVAVDEYAPVLALLTESAMITSMPSTDSEMLSAAVPHCFGAHPYQAFVLDELQKLFGKLESSRHEAVNAANLELSNIAEQSNTITAKIEEAKAQVAQKEQICGEKNTAMKDAEEALCKAKKAHEDVQNKEKGMAETHGENIAQKASYEELFSTVYTPLKDYAYVGKEWRLRDKQITHLMTSLQAVKIDESLSDSLPVVLKTKPDLRGKFAVKVLEFAEAAISEHIASLGEKISTFESAVTACSKEIEAAETVVKSCASALSTSQDEVVTAENNLSAAQTAESDLLAAQKSLGPQNQSAEAALNAAKESLASCMKLLGTFVQLKEPVAS